MPDYLADAGGLINSGRELLIWNVAQTMETVSAIYDTTLVVLGLGKAAGAPAHRVADSLAEARIAAGGVDD